MLAQRLRRWSSNRQSSGERPLFSHRQGWSQVPLYPGLIFSSHPANSAVKTAKSWASMLGIKPALGKPLVWCAKEVVI